MLAVILALEGKRSDTDIVSSIFGALFAVLLAEAYADYLGTMIGTGRRPTRPELRSTLALALGSTVAVIPPILLLLLGVSGVIGLDRGFTAAKAAGVAVIGAYAYAAEPPRRPLAPPEHRGGGLPRRSRRRARAAQA